MDEGDDLEQTLDELAGTLEQLREEVADQRNSRGGRRSRGERRSGGDRPSRAELRSRGERRSGDVGDLLRFTEQYTIPAVIAILEANIRMLELVAGSIRASDDPASDEGERSVSRTLDALDAALTDVSDAVDGRPTSPEARRLFREARELGSDIERRLEERTTTAPGAVAGDDDAVHEVPVDVEAELESIKREVDDADGGDRGGDGEGDDGSDDGPPGR